MLVLANFLIAVVAALHLYFLVLEMFLWTRPLGLKTFRNSLEKATDSAVLAANQGLYNGFLAAGLIEHRGGTTNLIRLGGLQKLAPLIAVLFFVPAMNLAGIPPFSGFIGKLGLLEAGIADGGWLPWQALRRKLDREQPEYRE